MGFPECWTGFGSAISGAMAARVECAAHSKYATVAKWDVWARLEVRRED